jgi:biotin carboxyl carrier protein
VAVRFRVVIDGEPHEIEVERGAKGLAIRVDGAEYRAHATSRRSGIDVRIGTRTYRVRFQGRELLLDGEAHDLSIPAIEDERIATSADVEGEASVREIRPPMPGRVVRILVRAGERVARGQVLLVLEAMKMQNEIPAPRGGIVREVRVSEGEIITADRVVAVLEASPPPTGPP